MDPDEHRDALDRLESDYLSGAMSADEYMRLRRQLHEGVVETADAEAAELRFASWGRRAAAILLDWLIQIVVIAAALRWAGILTSFIVFPLLYQWLMTGAWGQTLGKMALAVRVVRADDGGRVGYPLALGRVVSAWVLGFLLLPLLLAWLWPLWDKRNQTLYDKMVGTVVVRVR